MDVVSVFVVFSPTLFLHLLGYMWDVIRAKNGAYGAYSKFSSNDGIATLYTYRDPNQPQDTLDAFHAAADD